MNTCNLFTSANDIVLELKRIILTTFLHDYRKYNHIKFSNKKSRKSTLSNQNPIKSQTLNGNAKPNTQLSNVWRFRKIKR